MGARMALAVLLASCAGQAAGQAVATPPSDKLPAWQQRMDQARRMAATGRNYVIVTSRLKAEASGSGGVYVFYNNPRPFCYTYMIPGEWVVAPQPNAYRSKEGKAFVGVLFDLPGNLEGVDGATLVERARNAFTRWYEKASEQPVSAARLVPFESARGGTLKWTALPVMRGEGQSHPTRIIADLSPDAVVHITVRGTEDDDGLARQVVESLKTTTSPECYFPVLEKMLRATHGDR
jgi:hypothetical protein